MGIRRYERAFALPTIVITAVILMTLLVGGLSAVSSVRRGLNDQYYNKLAQEAAESGLAVAKSCLVRSGQQVTWSDASPLRPNTDCTGGDICTGSDSCYVLSDTSVKTTFSVGMPTVNPDGSYNIKVSGEANRMQSSVQVAWQTYSYMQSASVTFAVQPQLSGGAGWQGNGHIGVLMTATGQLYGFGDNTSNQLNNVGTPVMMSYPQKITLPLGVSSIKQVVASGQGASYMCIIGSDDKVYCRGSGMSLAAGWNAITGWPANYSVFDMSLNGYGGDNACFLAGTSLATAQVYCVGNDDWGKLGNGVTCANWGTGVCANSPYALDNAQQFILPGGAYAAKVNTMNDQVCVITTASDLYCAGLENRGQLTGSTSNTVTSSNGTRYAATPIKYNLPNGRKAKDVLVGGYHNSADIHVLATDGTVWTSGSYVNGDAGNSVAGTIGSTGTSQTPVIFGDGAQPYGTGDVIKLTAQNKCIGNYNNVNANNNPVVIFTCLGRSNQGQTWVYSQENHQIENVATGKCLNIPNRNFVNNQLLSIYTCNDDISQKFTFNSNGSISVDGASGKCVDVPGGNTTDGTQMQLWDCNNMWPQAFTPGGSINGWRGIIAGNTFFCALRDDVWSGMWCAGNNSYGQFANVGTMVGGSQHGNPCEGASVIGGAIRNMNAAPGEKVDWSRLTSEWQYQYDSMVFITKSGNVYGAGRNVYGKLGNEITGDAGNDYRTCYTRKLTLPTAVTAVDLSTRDEYSTYVLGSDGNIHASGRNDNGQLGNGTISTLVLTPVKALLPVDSTKAY